MREYKFRGKRVDTKEWVYGNYQKHYDSLGELHLIEVQDREDFEISVYHVLPESVGQFTGLKDKSGKEIYEGDIVQFRLTDSFEYNAEYDYEKYGDTPISAVMKWNEDACGFRVDFPARFKIIKSMLDVIGNIMDNPELVKSRRQVVR